MAPFRAELSAEVGFICWPGSAPSPTPPSPGMLRAGSGSDGSDGSDAAKSCLLNSIGMWAANAGWRSLFIGPFSDQTLVFVRGSQLTGGFFPPGRDFHCLGASCLSLGSPRAAWGR